MPPPTYLLYVHCSKFLLRRENRQRLVSLLGVIILLIPAAFELGAFTSLTASAESHTRPTVDLTCNKAFYSPDGNPFPLCPGPYPIGGNCVWWAWEQWHLLGYDLPLNWGNAADWIVDAERTGLPMGTTPRLGAIAVFPRGDGVWAYGPPGHVAFVTWVSPDATSFNVTYQNYGDPTPMYVGKGYAVSVINAPHFQNDSLRFIYFPRMIDSLRFASLPGVDSGNVSEVTRANSVLNSTNSTLSSSTAANSTSGRIALGLPPVSSDQEFNADFTGTGFSDLLLYNRQQGSLKVLHLEKTTLRPAITHMSRLIDDEVAASLPRASSQLVNLSDSTTPANKWGPSLDVHVGDFAGTGESDILLYDRVAGTIQLISLTPQLTIRKHVVLSGWGSDWELYVGRYDGSRSGVFMYKRFAQPDFVATATAIANMPTPPNDTSASPTPSDPAVKPGPSPTPRPKPTSKPDPTAKPSPSPTPKPDPTVKPSPSPTPQSDPTATPSPSPTPQPDATPQRDPTATPSPSPTPQPDPTAKPDPSPTLQRDPTARPSPEATATKSLHGHTPIPAQDASRNIINPSPSATVSSRAMTVRNRDLSGSAPQDWERLGRTANILVLDFNQDFSIRQQQQYSLWHANWEVYVGRFAGRDRDGIFLYDRNVGEARIMDFDAGMQVDDYQEIHNLDGNWIVYSGDFSGSGRAQLLLYDPSSGSAQILTFARDLSLEKQKTYSDWGTNMVLYVGHFGMPTLSVMLYDPQQEQSAFIAFSRSLEVKQQYTVQSWSARWQILVGAFLDRAHCLSKGNCSSGDDILALDRKTGRIQQYVFSFGRQFQLFDNRAQSFQRNGVETGQHLNSVDTTSFSLLNTLSTNVRDEELY